MQKLAALFSLMLLAGASATQVHAANDESAATDARAKHGKHGACRELVGTYLTKNFIKGDSGESFISRSLLTFARGGQVFFTDSGEAGEPGFAPFSDGRGDWRCAAEGDEVKARAIVLDFTFPKKGEGERQIGRLDLDVSYDIGEKKIEATAKLYLIPFAADPLHSADLAGDREFSLSGVRVEAP